MEKLVNHIYIYIYINYYYYYYFTLTTFDQDFFKTYIYFLLFIHNNLYSHVEL